MDVPSGFSTTLRHCARHPTPAGRRRLSFIIPLLPSVWTMMILSVHRCPPRNPRHKIRRMAPPASSVTLEFFDAQHNLVRRLSSEDQNPGKHSTIAVAERWFPKPEILAKTPGMHRFIWDLTWGGSGGPVADEDAAFQNPSGPKAVPGIYQVRLTIDGQFQSQPLEVAMDPRSAATPEVLLQQLQLGNQIFAETVEARRALAEI